MYDIEVDVIQYRLYLYVNINKNYILAVYVFWREHVGGHRLHTRSWGRAKQKMNGHATGRDRRHGMRAAQAVSGYVD